MARKFASSSTPRERGTGKGGRRAYQRPEIQPYGDIRELTAHGFRHKDWGPGDFLIFLHGSSPSPSGDPSPGLS
jgi:hypothetical protein